MALRRRRGTDGAVGGGSLSLLLRDDDRIQREHGAFAPAEDG